MGNKDRCEEDLLKRLVESERTDIDGWNIDKSLSPPFVRIMGIDEVKDIEQGTLIDVDNIDGLVKCFYCEEPITVEGLAGKGGWIFHEKCYHRYANGKDGNHE